MQGMQVHHISTMVNVEQYYTLPIRQSKLSELRFWTTCRAFYSGRS